MVNIASFGAIIVVTLVLFSLFGQFILPELKFFTPSIGLLIGAVILSAFLGFGIIEKKFSVGTGKDLTGLLIVAGIVVLMLLFGFGIIGGNFFKESITDLQSLISP